MSVPKYVSTISIHWRPAGCWTLLTIAYRCLSTGCSTTSRPLETSGPPSAPLIVYQGKAWSEETEYVPPQLLAKFRLKNPGPQTVYYAVYGDDPNPLVEARAQLPDATVSTGGIVDCANGIHQAALAAGQGVVVQVPIRDGTKRIRIGIDLVAAPHQGRPDRFWSDDFELADPMPAPPGIVLPRGCRERERQLFHAAEIGYDGKVRALLDAGVYVNTRPGRPDRRTPRPYPGGGWASADSNLTPLHVAAAHGHVEIVKMLIAAGADINSDDGCGGTPLIHATYNEESAAAEALIAAGANVNVTLRLADIPIGPHGLVETPLKEAMTHHDQRLVELLRRAGAIG